MSKNLLNFLVVTAVIYLFVSMVIYWRSEVEISNLSPSYIATSSTSIRKRYMITNSPSLIPKVTIKPQLPTTRVAVIILYMGDNLPAWFNTFSITASSTASLIDWLIFVTDAPSRETPPNVKLIRISQREISERLAKLDTKMYAEDPIFMTSSFSSLLERFSYVLVEFKPCLGFLFSDYLYGYSHWAFGDLDLLAGAALTATRQLTAQHLHAFDYVSFTFGDNYRLYLRGQLTIARNSRRTNTLWRDCIHLSKVGERLQRFMVGNNSSKSSGWQFQSAEGCYSDVVMSAGNVTVLFLPSQVSDAFRAPLAQREALLLGGSLLRCYEYGLGVGRNYSRAKLVQDLLSVGAVSPLR